MNVAARQSWRVEIQSFYSHDHWGVRFSPCENNFRQAVVYLNRKIDFHNLTL